MPPDSSAPQLLPPSCASHATRLTLLEEQIHADRAERQNFRLELRGTLARIEEQAVKTNGRVNRLEHWRIFLTGGFAALCLPAATKIAQLLSIP